MILLAYLLSQSTKFQSTGWWMCWILCPFICSSVSRLSHFAMDPTKEQRVCIRFCENLRRSARETFTMIRLVSETKQQSSRRESPDSLRPRMARMVKSKVKSLFIVFHIKGITHKEFALTGQTVNSVYYRDIIRRLLENMCRLHTELWQ
jgi:hypothetical protein